MQNQVITKPLLAIALLSLTLSCSDENAGPATEPEPLLASISYSKESYIPHYSVKDSIIYDPAGNISSVLQFGADAEENDFTYTFTLESNGYTGIRQNGEESVLYYEEYKSDSVRIRYYTEYSIANAKPTYVKFHTGKHKSLYERWEYTGGKAMFDMETEGKCVKRIEVFKDSEGNVSQVDSYIATSGSLQLIERYQNFTYSELSNPLKGYYLEPVYMQITYNKLPTAFEQSEHLFDYYERVVYNSSGNAIINQTYSLEYTVDQKGRVTGSKVSMNEGEFVADFTAITYLKR